MNLKKSVLSFMAAGAILAGGFGASSAAVDQTTSTSGTVTINTTGSFSPYFCNALDLGSLAPSTTAQTKSGVIAICFTDDISWRGGFNGYISSSDWSAGVNRTMPASSMTISSVTGVGQVRWSSGSWALPGCGDQGDAPVWGVNRPCIADIAARTPNTRHTGNPLTTKPWDGSDFGTPSLWVTEGSIEGRGTNGARQDLNVTMTIPANQASGVYKSTLTYDVVYTNGQP